MNEVDYGNILSWWSGLEHDTGGRAELRRAHSPTEVVFLPAYHRLYNKLETEHIDKEALACVAGLCAHIKENGGGKVAEQMSGTISNLRFRKLLAINSREELYHAMIRMIRQLKGTVNIIDLAKTVYWWNEKTKKDLAYAYYSQAKEKKGERS
ncbi:type I-E CRISPR-associated protein Cse2/CasB [bacterium]|jgi:CRISPR system Cascade subunit CasB|nr:type I-E CRISPR-associated protein Cse2/CasB [bacterium]